MVKILGYVMAALMVGMGALFVVAAAASGLWPRYVVGGVLMAAGLVLVAILRMKVADRKVEITQKVEVTGDVSLQQMKCKKCGGDLDGKDVQVAAGAAMVSCPYCGAQYQMEEEPKW